MLQAIRSKATSFVVKLLFGLLIVTFGVWGIGDIFRQRDTDTKVATVGGRAVTMSEMSQQVQREIDRLKQIIGTSVDAAQAKQLGVVDQALQHLISGDLIDAEIGRMGLAVGDEAVRNSIIANPAFHNQAGNFDRNLYLQILANNRLNDAQYETLQRSDLLRQQLSGALTDGVTPPKELVEALYRSRAERRVADIVTLPLTAGNSNPTPTDEQIAAYYHAHEDKFQAPERRSFKVAMLRIDDIAAGIELTDEQLKKEYNARPEEFHVAEQRHLMQMLLPDEATAKEAEAQLAAGKAFVAVAKEVAKMDDPAALDLGFVAQPDLPTELGDVAFAMKEGEISQPTKSTFGWHILRLDGIKSAEVQTFDQVKDKLKQEVARDRAADRVADLANSIDDAIAGGMSLDAVAEKFHLKTLNADDLDRDGKNPYGMLFELPQYAQAVMHTAFATDKGQTSALTDLGEDGYYIVQMLNVAPATTKPLAEIHDEVVSQWQAGEREQAVTKIANEIAADVKDGKTLQQVAAERHLTFTTTPALQRTSRSQQLTDQFIGKLFDAPLNGTLIDVGPTAINLAQLTKIEPGDPSKDDSGVKRVTQEVGQVMQADVLDEYDHALRQTFPVEVNQSNSTACSDAPMQALPSFAEFQRRHALGRPVLVWTTLVADLETPVSAMLKLADGRANSFLLESVEGGEKIGRYSVIGIKPDLIWRCFGDRAEVNRRARTDADAFEPAGPGALASLRALIAECRVDMAAPLPPMAAGLFGYMGYGMVGLMERLPDANRDTLGIPDGMFLRPTVVAIFDNIADSITVVTPVWPDGSMTASVAWERACERLADVVADLERNLPHRREAAAAVQELPAPTANMTREHCLRMVETAKEYIRAGEIFQVVPSLRFAVPFRLPPIALYRALRRLNPSPFLFFLDYGDFAVVGSSPEILVRLRDGTVSIRPLAGTRRRGATTDEDQSLAAELLADPKERAEHLMLLDLARNDVGRVAEVGTVKVTEQLVIERYSHVMHICSHVEGRLDPRHDAMDALCAGFPAGTLSGAPKVRAMEIIDELEPERRNLYGGAIGYFAGDGSMDTCIALRTALVKDGQMIVQAGCGVVADSDPASEYQEILDKARALFRAAEEAVRFARG